MEKIEEKTEEKTEIKKKDFFYRGQNVDYLKTLDVRESAKYFPSRSRRTILRNFDKIEQFIKKCEKKVVKNKKIKTHLREIVIVPKMVGLTIGIHNGRNFQELTILPEMMGHTLGEFSPTRSKVNHGTAGIGATKSSKAQKK
ncbi:MAG: ribosomal protein S19 family protein [Nanoarchaeota archaeon]